MKLLLTGDSILQRRLQSRDDPALKPLFDRVRAADVAFTNLEVLANDYRGDPALESGGSHFGAPSWVLDELVEAGFDLFATATNHSLDYSISGLLQSIQAMEQLGARRDRIVAAVGPCIAQASYEVDESFRSNLVGQAEGNGRFFVTGPSGKPHFDLAGYVVHRLASAGIHQPTALNLDTYSEPDRFYSYRRSTHLGEPSYGRQISMIGLP